MAQRIECLARAVSASEHATQHPPLEFRETLHLCFEVGHRSTHATIARELSGALSRLAKQTARRDETHRADERGGHVRQSSRRGLTLDASQQPRA